MKYQTINTITQQMQRKISKKQRKPVDASCTNRYLLKMRGNVCNKNERVCVEFLGTKREPLNYLILSLIFLPIDCIKIVC